MAPVASRGAGAGVGLARRKKASWGDTGRKDGLFEHYSSPSSGADFFA